jgi:hypothetical protein
MKSYLSKRNRKRQSRKTSKRHKKIEGGEKPLDVDYTMEESPRNKLNDMRNIMAVGRTFRIKDERLLRIKRLNLRVFSEIGRQSETDHLFALGKKYINLMYKEEMKRQKKQKSDKPLNETSPLTYYFHTHGGYGSDVFVERIMMNRNVVLSRTPPLVRDKTDRSDEPMRDDVVESFE